MHLLRLFWTNSDIVLKVIDFSLEGYERIQYVYNHIMAADGWTDVKKIIDPIEEVRLDLCLAVEC